MYWMPKHAFQHCVFQPCVQLRVYFYPAYVYPRQSPTFEPPNVQQFRQSAQSFIVPAQELQAVLHAIAQQEGFAQKLMNFAQAGQKDQVEEMIRTVGVHTPFKVGYNPDGIHVTFLPPNVKACFSIKLSLCW